jgi:hypothetical protein
MDERVLADDYIYIWMTSAVFTEVVRQVARELVLPITAGDVLLMAQRLRRDGVPLPARPGGMRSEAPHLTKQADGDYRDGHGRQAYPVGPGTPVEGAVGLYPL